MISQIQFNNFRALRDTFLLLSPFTLLVGPNGSGKSSVFRAMSLMAGFSPNSNSHLAIRKERSFGTETQASVVVQFRGQPRIRDAVFGEGGFQHNMEQLAFFRESRQFSLDPKAIMKPVHLNPHMSMTDDGGQLAGVLERLRDEHPERFEELNSALAEWLPEFDRVLFRVPQTGQKAFLLRTKIGQHPLEADKLSDGTLIALAVLTLSFLPKPPPLICLEEPDRGLHPRLLQDVKNAIFRLCYPEEFGEKREPVQVIATTHNPFFLDLFRDNPRQIVIAEKTGLETKFKVLADHPNLNEIIAGVPLGEVWYSGVLGGVPAGT